MKAESHKACKILIKNQMFVRFIADFSFKNSGPKDATRILQQDLNSSKCLKGYLRVVKRINVTLYAASTPKEMSCRFLSGPPFSL